MTATIRLTILARLGDAAIACDVAPRERVLDACDEAGAPVTFSCRSATCGSCRVVVLDGARLLVPPSPEELDVLRALGAGADERLACVARVADGDGQVVLRAVR